MLGEFLVTQSRRTEIMIMMVAVGTTRGGCLVVLGGRA